jgi:ABC-2 type transport system ATP-binding protein
MAESRRPCHNGPAIRVESVSKQYTFHEQQPGLRNAVKSLFHRTYQTRNAVVDITFTVEPGEFVGVLGANGAGKTTTLKMLCGLLRPTSGEVRVLGYQPADRHYAFLRRTSMVLGQKSMLWWDVPAMDSFLVHKAMYEIPTGDFNSSVGELSELLEVEHLLEVPVRKLSLGERMKCELILALIHRPDLLFLDEPTIGMDLVAKATVRDFLRAVNFHRGTTILLTSHDMGDVESLCPRVMVVSKGRLGYDGELAELVRSARPHKQLRLTFADPPRVPENLPPEVTLLPVANEHEINIETPRELMQEVLRRVPAWGSLIDIDVTDPDVDEIVREIFARERSGGRR